MEENRIENRMQSDILEVKKEDMEKVKGGKTEGSASAPGFNEPRCRACGKILDKPKSTGYVCLNIHCKEFGVEKTSQQVAW